MKLYHNGEGAGLNLLGQTIEFIWRGGAIKVFVQIFLIITFGTIIFSFRISPIIPFILFIVICIGVLVYLAILLPRRPELFQDSQTWLGHQRLLQGNKQKGLYLPNPNESLFQPITQRKTISAKANITTPKKIVEKVI